MDANMNRPAEGFQPELEGGPPGAALHRFTHEAMATSFELILAEADAQYAANAARAAFDELDRLEQELSRYLPTSDISRINGLAPGASALTGLAAYECLQLAEQYSRELDGAFDVTIGPLLDWWKAHAGMAEGMLPEHELIYARSRTGMRHLELSQSEPRVTVKNGGLVIDLGAIGKGYAVDQMVALLRDWSIEAALVHGGQSSLFAVGAPPGQEGWRLALRDPRDQAATIGTVCLRDCSISGSGVFVQGHHIISPRTGRPARGKLGVWAIAPSAAASDAISTGFMVMAEAEIDHYCAAHPEVAGLALLEEAAGEPPMRFGAWGRWAGEPDQV